MSEDKKTIAIHLPESTFLLLKGYCGFIGTSKTGYAKLALIKQMLEDKIITIEELREWEVKEPTEVEIPLMIRGEQEVK